MDKQQPLYSLGNFFYYKERTEQELFFVHEVKWSIAQNQWMYTVFYPLRKEKDVRKKFRSYGEKRLRDECEFIKNQSLAIRLYGKDDYYETA